MSKFKAGDKVRRSSHNQGSWWSHICKLNNKNPFGVFEVSDYTPEIYYYIHIVGLSEGFNPKNQPRFDDEYFELVTEETPQESASDVTYTGGSSGYYQVTIKNTTTPNRPSYIAECNDIIEALDMNFAEGNAFKALWRRAAQRTLGLRKAGAKEDGLYDAEKVEFFGKRLVEMSKGKE